MKLALLFDLDGTLIDSSLDIAAAINYSMKTNAGFEADVKSIMPYIGSTLEETFRGLLPSPGEGLIRRCEETYKIRYFDHCTGHTKPYPKVGQILRRLRSRKRAVVTTKRTYMARHVLEAVGLAHLFDLVLGTEDGVKPKPDPGVILLACRMLQTEPASSVVIGDTEHDVNAGKAAGCRTIAVTWGIGKAKDLRRLNPDAIIDVFDKLPEIIGRWE